MTTSFPLLSIMFLIFLTLKLCSVVDWSWWLVTAPLWGGFALWLTIVGGICMYAVSCSVRRR